MVKLIEPQKNIKELSEDTKALRRGVNAFQQEARSTNFPKFVPVTRNKDGSFNIQGNVNPDTVGLTRNQDGSFSVTNDRRDDLEGKQTNKQQIKIDEEAFDDKASTVFEETKATFDKQAAMFGLVANAYGLVSDQETAQFVADHSIALHNAQLHAPKYVKRFQKEFEDAQGFFESAGVILSNPRAIGRLVVTQTPNSVAPLAMGFAGAGIGSAVPLVGSILGFAGGTFVGSSIVEIGAWIDQQLQKKGINTSDPEQLLQVLRDDEFMVSITREAEKKGLSTAAVDTLFTLFGGKLLAGAGKGIVKKGVRFAGDVGIESVGEAAGEAAGQAAATGKIEGKEVALEGIAGLGQSSGQAIALSTLRKATGKEPAITEEKVEEKTDGQKEEKETKDTKVSGDLKETIEDVEESLKKREKTPEQKSKAKAKAEEKKQFKETINNLQEGSTPLVNESEVKTPGIEGKLSKADKFQNTLAQGFNGIKKRFIALHPMDVVFDKMDKGAAFTGINFRTFKRPIDLANKKRATQVAAIKDPILKLHAEKKFDVSNYTRILVWATLKQDESAGNNNGRGKLLRSFEEVDIDKIQNEGLTQDETEMLKLMQSKFEILKPQLKQVMKEVYGKDFKEVEDFFPMLTDFDAMETTEIQNLFGGDAKLLQDLIVPERKPKAKEVSTKPFKERVGGKVPIKTNALVAFLQHVDNATYLINMGKDITNLIEIASTEEYRQAVGSIGQESVLNWLRLLARRGGAEGGRIGALDWLRNNVGVAVLGYKLSTILIQPTALLDGAGIIGGYAFKGAVNTWGFSAKQKAWRKFVKDNSVEIQLRVADDPAFAAFMDDVLDDSIMGQIKKHAFTGVRFLDSLTATAIAAGAYEKVVTEKGGKVDFANPDADAFTEAELIVRRSQASGQFKDLPAVSSQGAFTGNVSVDKLIFQFQTFMLGRASIVSQVIGKPDSKATALIATYLTAALIAEVLVRRGVEEIFSQLTGDEPDEPLEDVFFKKLALEAVGAIPVVSQGVNAIRYKQVPIPVLSLAQQGVTRAGLTISTKDDKKQLVQAARAITELAGVIGGVPGASQIDQIIGKVFKDKKKSRRRGSTRF